EAVARMRRGQVYREGGYDGEYGTVRVFSPEELADARGTLPGVKAPAKRGRKKAEPLEFATAQTTAGQPASVRVRRASLPLAGDTNAEATSNFSAVKSAAKTDTSAQAFAYSDEQQTALAAGSAPVLVLAGPGAGKTRVLVGRLQWLAEQSADMRRVLAVTFTRRAADELRERLSKAFDGGAQTALPQCDTLHGMAWAALRAASADNPPLLLGEDAALNLFRLANPELEKRDARKLWDALALAREGGLLAQESTQSPLARAAANYAARKNMGQRYVDYADLLDWWLEHARALPENERPQHVLVDEVQDLSSVQLAIVRALLPADGHGFFGIGDPDQAIYGFRGVTGQSEASLRACWPGLNVFRLGQSFRSSQSVLDMARSLLHHKGQCGPLLAAQSLTAELRLFSAPDERTEARWVAERVRHLLGATAHTLLDHSKGDDLHGLAGALAPGDIAVLVRLKAQIPPLRAALEQAGIPCAAPSQDGFWQDAACARLLSLLGAHCGFAHVSTEDQDQQDTLPQNWASAGSLPAPERMLPWLAEQPWAGEVFTGSRPWRELCRLWNQSGHWAGFFEQLAWLQEAELVRAKAESVQILTLHASKGLEFQAVFLPGLEDGLLPLRREL
uniref:ATP-dependent helicase n=1 Tax=Desulfovibrio sp. TaxID=885 RepID=UPI0026340567